MTNRFTDAGILYEFRGVDHILPWKEVSGVCQWSPQVLKWDLQSAKKRMRIVERSRGSDEACAKAVKPPDTQADSSAKMMAQVEARFGNELVHMVDDKPGPYHTRTHCGLRNAICNYQIKRFANMLANIPTRCCRVCAAAYYATITP